MSWRSKNSWQVSFLSCYKGSQDWTPIVSLGNKHLYPWRHRLSNPPFTNVLCVCMCMCICMYVCTPVEHRRQPLLSSSGIPSTSYKSGSLSGPDQPSRPDWPTREHQKTSPYLSSTQPHTWQFTWVSNGKNILQVIFIWGKLPCIVIDLFRVTFDEPFLLFEVEVRLWMDSAVREAVEEARHWKLLCDLFLYFTVRTV